MTEYAVVNPATGETLATYPTITDDAARGGDREGGCRLPRRGATRPSPSAPRSSAAWPSCTASAATSSPRSSCARWASRSPPRYGEVDFAADITEYYADNAEKITGDQPIDILGEGTAIIRRSPIGVLLGHHAVELPVLPGRALRGAEPRDRQHDPAQARLAVPRVGGRDRADATATPASRRARTSTSTRPTSRRRPSSPTRACRASRSPARSAPAPRSPRSPAATSRRSRWSSADPTRSSCCPPTTSTAPCNAAVEARLDNNGQSCNARQALHRGRRPVRRVPREVHRGDGGVEDGRPVRRRHRARPAVVADRGRAPAGAGRQGGRAGRDAS